MIRAVLFDRDGTLIADDPVHVRLMPGARSAVARLRERGLRIAVVTNQPRAGESLAARNAMKALHAQIDAELGGLDGWFACTHAPQMRCACRKPQPGLVHEASRALGVASHECVVVGDIGSDVEAARRAGARAILVPTPVTRREEIAAAPAVCATLLDAVRSVLEQTAA